MNHGPISWLCLTSATKICIYYYSCLPAKYAEATLEENNVNIYFTGKQGIPACWACVLCYADSTPLTLVNPNCIRISSKQIFVLVRAESCVKQRREIGPRNWIHPRFLAVGKKCVKNCRLVISGWWGSGSRLSMIFGRGSKNYNLFKKLHHCTTFETMLLPLVKSFLPALN